MVWEVSELGIFVHMKHLSTNMSAQFVLLCTMLKNWPKELVTKNVPFKTFAKKLLFYKRAKNWPTYSSHVFTINDENGNEIGNRGYRGKFICFKFIDKYYIIYLYSIRRVVKILKKYYKNKTKN